MTTNQVARWVALPLAVGAVSTSGVLIRLTTAAPLLTASARMVAASAILLTVVAVRHRAEVRRLDGATARLLAGSGLLLGVHFALWTNSLFWTSVASAVLLVDTHPVIVALAARLFLGEVTVPRVWAGIALTLCGSAVVAAGDFQIGGRALVGDLMALGSAATFAGYLVIGRRVRQGLSLPVYTGLVYGLAAVVLLTMTLGSGLSLLSFSERDAGIWALLILLPTLGGHTVLNWALRHVSAAIVGVSLLGEPVLTTTWAWLLLGEPPPSTALLGGAVILAGLYLALREPGSTTRRPVDPELATRRAGES